jgi:hypothetical protein
VASWPPVVVVCMLHAQVVRFLQRCCASTTNLASGPACRCAGAVPAHRQAALPPRAVQVWPVRMPNGELRVAVLNKGWEANCTTTLQFTSK